METHTHMILFDFYQTLSRNGVPMLKYVTFLYGLLRRNFPKENLIDTSS